MEFTQWLSAGELQVSALLHPLSQHITHIDGLPTEAHFTSGKKCNILSLIGKLAHAAKIIIPGRIFLRRMIDVAHKAKQLDHWVYLTADFKSDLAWWHCFIDHWNGLGMMQSVAANWSPQYCFFTDASGSWGCGACWEKSWIQCPWNSTLSNRSTARKRAVLFGGVIKF